MSLRPFLPAVVLLKKFLNTTELYAVFMSEGRRLVAGDAILNDATTLVRRQDVRSQDQVVEDLVRQHARLVYRIAYAVLRQHHDAEDATQETFIRVLRYSRKLAAVQDHKTWLARIAWRVAVDRSKRLVRRKESSLDDPHQTFGGVTSSDAAADDTVLGKEIGSLLERMIAALPEKLREPLVLSTIDEMSPREVAATLRINEAAVRSRVFRARQILREKLRTREK
jgi:RNA polymerase sigma-70 factor, ECF subfamily